MLEVQSNLKAMRAVLVLSLVSPAWVAGCAQDREAFYTDYFHEARIVSEESRERAASLEIPDSDIPYLVLAMVNTPIEDGILLLLAQKDRLPISVRNQLYKEVFRRESVPLVDAMVLSVPAAEAEQWSTYVESFLDRDLHTSLFSGFAGMFYASHADYDNTIVRPYVSNEFLAPSYVWEFYDTLPVQVQWVPLEDSKDYALGEIKFLSKPEGYRDLFSGIVGAYRLLVPFFKHYFSVDYAPEVPAIRAVSAYIGKARGQALAPFFYIRQEGDIFTITAGQTQGDRWDVFH